MYIFCNCFYKKNTTTLKIITLLLSFVLSAQPTIAGTSADNCSNITQSKDTVNNFNLCKNTELTQKDTERESLKAAVSGKVQKAQIDASTQTAALNSTAKKYLMAKEGKEAIIKKIDTDLKEVNEKKEFLIAARDQTKERAAELLQELQTWEEPHVMMPSNCRAECQTKGEEIKSKIKDFTVGRTFRSANDFYDYIMDKMLPAHTNAINELVTYEGKLQEELKNQKQQARALVIAGQSADQAKDSLNTASGSDFNLGEKLGVANLGVGIANGVKGLIPTSNSSGASKGGQVNTGGASSPSPLNLNNDWDTGAGTGFQVTADDAKANTKETNLDTTIATGGSPNATDGAPSSSASKLLSTDVKNAIKDRLAAAAASSAGKAGASTGGLISDKSEGIENQNGEGAKTDDTGKNTDVLASIETGEGLGGGMSDLGLAGSDTDASIKDIMQDMLGSVMGDDPTTDSNNRSPASVGEITFDLNGRAIVPSNKDIGNEESTPLTERIRSAIQRQFAKGNIVYGLRNKI